MDVCYLLDNFHVEISSRYFITSDCTYILYILYQNIQGFFFLHKYISCVNAHSLFGMQRGKKRKSLSSLENVIKLIKKQRIIKMSMIVLID